MSVTSWSRWPRGSQEGDGFLDDARLVQGGWGVKRGTGFVGSDRDCVGRADIDSGLGVAVSKDAMVNLGERFLEHV